jgi:hypothetical protein
MEPPFKTADSILAATIIASVGAILLGIDTIERTRVKYIFAGDSIPDGLIDAYERGDVRVDPVMFCLAQNYLRQQVDRDIRFRAM